MDADGRRLLNELSERVIGCAFEVSRVLGSGFLERVYRESLAHELRQADITAVQEERLIVRYKGVVVGEYLADLLVEGQLIVELKCCKGIAPEHVAQTLNYLKATGLHLALILNFQQPRLEIKRVVREF